jgi:hypothetical protein
MSERSQDRGKDPAGPCLRDRFPSGDRFHSFGGRGPVLPWLGHVLELPSWPRLNR